MWWNCRSDCGGMTMKQVGGEMRRHSRRRKHFHLQPIESLEPRRLLSASPLPPPPLPVIPTGFGYTFNVLNFGATGNGVTDDTAAIQSAINAAQAAGGGTVVLPVGFTFLSNPLTVTGNHVDVQINGTLEVQPYGVYSNGSISLLTFSDCNNVEVTGTGLINGQG